MTKERLAEIEKLCQMAEMGSFASVEGMELIMAVKRAQRKLAEAKRELNEALDECRALHSAIGWMESPDDMGR